MTNTVTETNLLAHAELRTKNTMKENYFCFIQANIKKLKEDGEFSDRFTNNQKN